MSVVVCTHNGAATLRDCLDGVLALDYPRVEAIVVDDGSTDASAAIARELGVRTISTANRGLSAARTTGLKAARGEIVAYLDDDARPDPDWLTYLALAFRSTAHAGVGGPNIPPPEETGIAACVANTPGGPVHVLLSDTEAEHLPGCNMAFRREALLAVGGFDARFRVAGDDVDVCWALQARGETLGFHPAAMVWHRRRTTCAASCASSAATAGRRRCSSASGPRSTTARVTRRGAGASTGARAPARCGGPTSTTARGGPRPSSPRSRGRPAAWRSSPRPPRCTSSWRSWPR
jgi:GT2 family glycosyltransferase